MNSLKQVAWIALASVSFLPGNLAIAQEAESTSNPEAEAELIANTQQLTFEGLRSGEGYFSADATKMVFQSERDPANPFYQIFLMDLSNGDIEKVSTGQGKTTCAWIHPDGEQILFSGTHHDPTSVEQQNNLLKLRQEGKQPRYSWDYDPEFDIYIRQPGGELKRITKARGYDAEASFSPDGKQIVFASNRSAYDHALSEREQELLRTDKSYFIDLYIMNSDGSNHPSF